MKDIVKMKNIVICFICVISLQILGAQDKGTGLFSLTPEEIIKIQEIRSEFIGAGDLLYDKLSSSYGDENQESFDLRLVNGISDVKDQFECGSCWAFSTLAAMESSNLLINKKRIDLSEQQLVNCVGQSKGCDGGYPEMALQELLQKNKGVVSEKEMPYQNTKGNCGLVQNSPVKVSNWGQLSKNASISEIKKAIVKHGAVVAALNASTYAFKSYNSQSEILQDQNTGKVSHAVVIAGWDDAKQAWLIKNSWGIKWGQKGYGWVKYGKQDLKRFSWVDVTQMDDSYELPAFTEEDMYTLNITSVLGSIQEYQKIGLFIDSGKKVYKYGMNKKNVKYNNKVKLTPGTHKITVITYSKIAKDGKRSTILGESAPKTVVMNGDKSYKIAYRRRIKNPNVFELVLIEDDIEVKN